MHQQELARRSVHHAARVRELFQGGNGRAQGDPLLSRALDELAVLLEALETTEAELTQARDRQLDGYALLETELQTYRDLFTHAPFAYLTTRIDGTVRRANLAAQQVFAGETKLIGRQLADLLPANDRRECIRLLQRLGHTNATERFTTGQWTLEGSTACNSAGRPHEIRWTALPAGAPPTTDASRAADLPDADAAAHVHCFADALRIVHQTGEWAAAGLQLAHLLTTTWAELVLLERWAPAARERIIGVRGAREQSESCVVRQRVDPAAPDTLPPVGSVIIADDAVFRRLGLFTEVCDWGRMHLPLRGYHTAVQRNDRRWHTVCVRSAEHADYTVEQRAMLDVLTERMGEQA